jgi:hypothetical protein
MLAAIQGTARYETKAVRETGLTQWRTEVVLYHPVERALSTP